MKKLFLILISAAVLFVVGYFWYQNYKIKNQQPSLVLVSPNGGETLKTGSVFTIKWDSKNVPSGNKISITIRRTSPPDLPQEGQEFDPIVFINLDNTGSKEWDVSDMYPSGNYMLGITSYASLPITESISDESNAAFQIIRQDKTAGWQTYNNSKIGYKVEYPENWTYREFPSTKTGAGFRPISSPEEISSECVNVDARTTAVSQYNIPFEEYARKAAIVEIQNFEKLNSIESITSESGAVGYKTTWIYKTFNGQQKISDPITYFDFQPASQGSEKYKTIQISLNGSDCEEIYNQMIKTFEIN